MSKQDYRELGSEIGTVRHTVRHTVRGSKRVGLQEVRWAVSKRGSKIVARPPSETGR